MAERPSAMKLFPEETVVFVRMANAKEFGERVKDSSTGRMLQDPQLKPFVESLYGKAGELYAEKGAGVLGLNWDDLQKLPQGEVAFGVVTRDQRRPALVLLIDQGDEASVADKLLDRALELSEQDGANITKEKISGVEVTIVRDKDRENRMFGVFERENTIVVATDSNVIRNILHNWDSAGDAKSDPKSVAEASAEAKQKEDADKVVESDEAKKEAAEFVPSRTLAQNERFAMILQNCRRPNDPPPQLVFYIDPIELMRNVGRGNAGFQLAVGLFPSLGIDGLQAVGGAFTYATDEYDNISQFHVMLENPRSGVMLLPAFEACTAAPQPFVPQDVATYITWNGNLRTTYDRTEALVDQFRFKGAVSKWVQENISDKLGIDFVKDVIDNLKGRYTWMVGYDKPTRFQGEQHVLAAELADEAAALESLKTVMRKYPDLFEEKKFGQVTYYRVKSPREEDNAEEEVPYTPCVGIVDGYLFVSTSCQRFEQSVAARDGTAERLVDSNDYVRAAAVIGRETRGITPVMFSVHRQEEQMRQWYGLLTSEKTRTMIDENKEGNPVLQALADVMDQHKLPPFEVLAPYLAPGGGILYDTDSGYHAISFELRNEVKPADGTEAK
jgi:hypothetical protein